MPEINTFKITDVEFAGQCPGGTYIDTMGKELPCPRKKICLPGNHDIVQKALLNGEKPTVRCPRCKNTIKLTLREKLYPSTNEKGERVELPKRQVIFTLEG